MRGLGIVDIAYTGIIAALYALLTVTLAPFSYGVYQVRVAEALTVLPFVYAPSIIGLYVGCLVANIFGGNGLPDIVFGSLLTLLAAVLTHKISKIKSRKLAIGLAPLPPVLINAFGVAVYLSEISGMSYLFVVQMVGLGELIACYLFGIPLLLFLISRKSPFKFAGAGKQPAGLGGEQ
jgi:uncharacterized membrane protein